MDTPKLSPIEPALPYCCQTRALTLTSKETSQCPPPCRPQRPHTWAQLLSDGPCILFISAISGPWAVFIFSLALLTTTLNSHQTYITHKGQADVACILSDALKGTKRLPLWGSFYLCTLEPSIEEIDPKSTSGKQMT